MKQTVFILLTSLLLTIISGFDCLAAPSLVLSGQGAAYDLRADGFDGVGGIDVTLAYDAMSLANPRISQRGMLTGAMMVPNLATPGVIRIGIISPNTQGLSGSGSILGITFDAVGSGTGQIISFTVTAVSIKGARIDVQTMGPTSATAAPVPSVAAGQQGSTQRQGQSIPTPYGQGAGTPQPATVSVPVSGAAVALGTVSMPVSPPPSPKSPEAPVPPPPAPVAEPPALTPPEASSGGTITGTEPVPRPAPVKAAPLPDTAVTAANPSNAVRKSVLTLFQEYAGVRTPQALTALFAQAASPGSRQEPPVVLSDGVRKVKVTIYMTAAQAPNFSLTGGKMTRLTRESGGYTLEMIPDARVIEATVTMLNQGKTTVIPLTVAPPVDIKTVPTGKFDEAAFAHYLKGGDAAIGDLNGDGMKNYIDDYIFTANYLVRKSTK